MGEDVIVITQHSTPVDWNDVGPKGQYFEALRPWVQGDTQFHSFTPKQVVDLVNAGKATLRRSLKLVLQDCAHFSGHPLPSARPFFETGLKRPEGPSV